MGSWPCTANRSFNSVVLIGFPNVSFQSQSDAIFIFVSQIKLDIIPDKGWQSEDMFVPPGYHLDSKITDDAGSPKEAEQAAFTYPAGLGTVMMNGCYGTGYKEGDPCYVAKWTLDACLVSK